MKSSLLITTALVAGLFAVPAFAQSAPPAPNASSQAFPSGPSGDMGDDMGDEGPDEAAPGARGTPSPTAGQGQAPLQGARAGKGGGDHIRKQFSRMDANHDGAVDEAELEASAMRKFNRADTNHDGKLDTAELNAAEAKRKERLQKRASRSGREVNERQLNRDPLRRADRNKDDVLTKEEYLAGPLQTMQRADTNHDGKVTQAEMESALSRRASK